MRIRNTTKWNTDDLRKLFSRCIQEVRKVEKRGKNKGIEVEVKNDNVWKHHIRGRAWIGWYRMMIKIGNEVDLNDIEKRKGLAKVFIHEYYHNLGFRQQDYRNYKNDWTADWDVDFVKDYPIRIKKEKPKPKRDLQIERYQKALKYVKDYQTKAKRVKNLLKKWQQKKRYYEKVLVAAGKIKPEK